MNAHAIDLATDFAGRVLRRSDTVTHRPDSSVPVRGRILELTRSVDGRSWATLRTADGEATLETNDLALFS